jgi:hypothetical protein
MPLQVQITAKKFCTIRPSAIYCGENSTFQTILMIVHINFFQSPVAYTINILRSYMTSLKS